MSKRLLLPRSQAVGLDGRPLAGAKLYTYITGTSTPKPVFSDAGITIPHANPVIADAAGRFPAMFLGAGDYRTVLTDANDATIATDDPVEGNDASAAPPADIAVALLAARRNRLVNPAMQISQQAGTGNTDITTGTVYSVDQWAGGLSTTPGGTLRLAQVASVTPGGSPFRLRATAQVADAAIAAGDFYTITQPIEGQVVSDALFGTATARPVLLRLGLRSSIAGTFGVSLTNGASARSWVGLVTIAAGETNTDLLRTFVIPGDITGTWATDASAGMVLRLCLAAGVTFRGATGWQAGNVMTTAAQSNFMATGGATFDVFDAGLYVDVAALSLLPPFELPDPVAELQRALRYWARTQVQFSGATVSGTGALATTNLPPMRAVSPGATSTNIFNTGSIGATPAVTVATVGSFLYVQDNRVAGAGTAGTYGTSIDISARL